MTVTSKDKGREVGNEGRKELTRTTKALRQLCKEKKGLFLAPWQLADNVITSCSNTNPMYTTKRQFYGLPALMFPHDR